MKPITTSYVASLILSGALFLAGTAASAAEREETTLSAHAAQMDSLASSRGESTVTSRISSDFSAFAGSQANADALVNGLRNGSAITLTTTTPSGTTSSTTFTPPTGKMGYGNVFISLALAKQQLAGLGITQPTAQQLQAALTGGAVTTATGTTTNLQGVLQMRSQGMGWGQIANSLGFKLGPVVSGMKAANSHLNAQAPARAGTTGETSAASPGAAGRQETGIVTGTGERAGSPGGGVTSDDRGAAAGRGIVTGASASGATPRGGAGTGGRGRPAGKPD